MSFYFTPTGLTGLQFEVTALKIFFLVNIMTFSLQSIMGQNQDKMEGEEQILHEELEDSRPCRDFESMDARAADTTEGEGSLEKEVQEESDEQDSLHQKQRPCKEPTSSTESYKQLWEVRQGGAAEKEGGGRTTSRGTDKNHKSSPGIERTHKLFNQIDVNPTKAGEDLQASSEIKMEHQAEETIPPKEENQDSVMLSNTYGAQTGSELLPVPVLSEAEEQDIKLNEVTEGCMSERKEPRAQPPHPLKNSLQKESLLDISAAIQRGAPRERMETETKEETLKDDSVWNEKPKITDADDQREVDRQHPQMDSTETNEVMASTSASNTALLVEPSSILEKLLKRNKTEATSSLSKIKEVDIQDTLNVPGSAGEMVGSRLSAASSDQHDQSGNDIKMVSCTQVKERDPETLELEMKETVSAQSLTSDVLCVQAAETTHVMSGSSLTKSHSLRGGGVKPAKALVKVNEEIKRSPKPSQSVPLNISQSAASHERTSPCEVSGVVVKRSAPHSKFRAELPSANAVRQIVEPSQIVPAEKSDMKSSTTGSDSVDHESGSTQVVKEGCDDTSVPAGDAGAVLVADGTVLTQKSHQVSASMKQDHQNQVLYSENTPPHHPERKPCTESHDGVTMRDKSQNEHKPRPVSELIKETIQLHEKLQHHERPKPAEVKCEEQGQSVKVAQMKAAFDSPHKPPDRTMERKPSVRRGKKETQHSVW